MTEYIERDVVIDDIGDLFTICYETLPNEYGHHFIVEKELQTHLDFVRNLPAADVVEVVRCKDCIYSRFDLDMSEKAAPWLLCKKLRDAMFPLMVAKTDYCCWAERKEG